MSKKNSNPGIVNLTEIKRSYTENGGGISVKENSDGTKHYSAWNRSNSDIQPHHLSWDESKDGAISNVHSTKGNHVSYNYKGGYY